MKSNLEGQTCGKRKNLAQYRSRIMISAVITQWLSLINMTAAKQPQLTCNRISVQ